MKKLDIKTAKQIPMYEIMEKLGIAFQKEKGINRWYFSPFRDEKTPSFKVNRIYNKYYDFGTEEYGDNINLIQRLKGFNTSEALEYISLLNINTFSFGKQSLPIVERETQSFIVNEISDPSLISYITAERGISLKNAKEHCSEITIDEIYKYIGFKNDKDGYALRNSFHKRAISPVGITSKITGAKALQIFEGFMDYLSFKEIIKSDTTDYIVLNSISNLKQAVPLLSKYEKIHSFLDNDEAGNKATEELKYNHPKVHDYSIYYMKDTDLNFFHLYGKESEKLKLKEELNPNKERGNQLSIT